MATAKKRGEKYRVRYDWYDENGVRHQKSVTAETKKDAERLASLRKENVSSSRRITFGQAVDKYIKSKSNVLSPSTLTGYTNIAKHHLGLLKSLSLDSITNELLQTQINAVSADFSPKTARNVRALISATLKMFMPDFVPIMKVPASIKKEITIPTEEELNTLIQCASGRPEEIPIKLAAFGSLRRGEISALFPDCIHDTYISIRRAYAQDPGNNWVLNEHPKTKAGYRDIPLPGEIMEQLHKLVEEYPEEGRAYGICGLNPNQINTHFETSRKRAGLSIRFHDLRHYFASMLHARNVPDQTIAKLGGWDDVATLHNIYQHSTKKAEDSAAQIITSLYDNVTKNVTKES